MSTSKGTNVIVQGRLLSIWGNDLWKGQVKTDDRTKQPVLDNSGQPINEWGFLISIPKSICTQDQMVDGGAAHFLKAMNDEAMSIYPNGMPPNFAWKMRDGDTAVDNNGQPYSNREGYKGCYVLTCNTRYAVPVFKHHQGAYVQISEGVNAGDYVNVQLSIKAHPAAGNSKPGLYLGPTMVLLVQKGEPIVTAMRDPNLTFGAQAPQAASWMVPASTPQAPASFNQFAQQQAPQGPMTGTMSGGMPMMQQQQAPQAPVTPHYGTLPQTHQPQMQQQAPQGMPMTQQQQAPQMPAAPAPTNGMPFPFNR